MRGRLKLLAGVLCQWQIGGVMDHPDTAVASPLRVERGGGSTTLHLAGRLDDKSVAGLWNKAVAAASGASGSLRVECSGVDYCGGAGFALLVALEEASKERGGKMQIEGLDPKFRRMFEAIDWKKLEQPLAPTRGHGNWVADLGHAAAQRAGEWSNHAEFVGELSTGLVGLARQPRRLRLREWWGIVEKAGANALPIVALISFLMGMIMAFQSAMPMRQFGVDIFVVNLVALAITRELGPLMTAVVLAGRSGSAFAAEIGTMKVNEEVAALTTMGLSPVRFLAVPRVLAGIVVTPVLTVYAMAIGIGGGLFVMMFLGFPLTTLMHQLAGSLTIHDVLAGLIKSFFFGAVVAGVGCMRGLQTGAGAAAVGDATTRAVVTGIFLIVVLDAIFAVIYYQLGF